MGRGGLWQEARTRAREAFSLDTRAPPLHYLACIGLADPLALSCMRERTVDVGVVVIDVVGVEVSDVVACDLQFINGV